MTPCQFVRQCLTFWKCDVKFTHIGQVRPAETFALTRCKITGQGYKESFAVFSPCVTIIFHSYLSVVVVGLVAKDGHGAVELFGDEKAYHFVAECHARE